MKRFNVDLGGFGLGLGVRSGSGPVMDAKASKLLDSDMSDEEFRDKWLEYAANKILGDHAKVKISLKDCELNFDQTPAKRAHYASWAGDRRSRELRGRSE